MLRFAKLKKNAKYAFVHIIRDLLINTPQIRESSYHESESVLKELILFLHCKNDTKYVPDHNQHSYQFYTLEPQVDIALIAFLIICYYADRD